MEIIKLGEGLTLTLPPELCEKRRMQVGDPFMVSVVDGHLTLTCLIEVYTPERIAQFHLNNACTEEEYRWAVNEVLSMGVDPLKIDPKALILGDQPWRKLELYLDRADTLRDRSGEPSGSS